ncbi:MAG: glutamate synthase subunit beta [Verrucomicrobiae bacterium]|nr:glutamate synthase subunit beta [Verrucomicrobiae bacterium]
MGKPAGYIEYERETAPERPELLRISDWHEFHLPVPEESLRTQAARCMDCGTPFCHAGTLLKGLPVGCPLWNLIPEWNDLVYKGLWREAMHRLLLTNNFPEFTGRVCPAPCEGSCVLGIHLSPVTIKEIELSIIEIGWERGWIRPEPPKFRTGKRVAVVGAGPAGLAAAAQLNHSGHLVTVFDRADRPGGLLMYGIPNMKLDKSVVQRRITLMSEEGVVFRTGVNVGVDLSANDLLRNFDAVILCIGATKPRDITVKGRELSGIHFAVDYLSSITRDLLDRQPASKPISATGKDVVVIGGGDTGTDCVASAILQGCRSVTQIEILPSPPSSRSETNPWPEWPKVLRLDYGHKEAIAKLGCDPRVYSTTVKEFVGNSHGELIGVVTVQVKWSRDNDGRPMPVELPGTERLLPAQLVLIAMGFTGPESYLLEQMGLQLDARRHVRAEYGRFATNLKGVFAAGDCRRGQSLVVWAISEGRGAARECDRYLMGKAAL